MVMDRVVDVGAEDGPLRLADLPVPEPGPAEVRIRVSACGVCHTELDMVEGRTPPPRLPVVPGHQVVGRVDARGEGARRFGIGDRVGVAWIFSACGLCTDCREGRENLCPSFLATGRDANGGYAEWMCVPEAFAHRLPRGLADADAAPLLCAGAVGYRSLRLAGVPERGALGFAGFGSSGHLVLQLVRRRYPALRAYVFARSDAQRQMARDLGAVWAGGYGEAPAELLDAVIDTTPAWSPVKKSLEVLKPGGRLIINAIRKEAGDREALLEIDYARHLWMEKEIKSVANVTRRDVADFLREADRWGLSPHVQCLPLEAANSALKALRSGGGRGAKVLLTAQGG
jgi:propanol-preferring alcohol dehydrogenase